MGHKWRWLCLGDSYTIGEGVGAEDRWPSFVVDRIRGNGGEIELPVVVAKTGWTTDELFQAIGQQGIHGTWDLVTLMIGVNDQYRGRAAEVFLQNLRPLIDFALRSVDGDRQRLVGISIPDWSVTPFAAERDTERIRAEIDQYNVLLETEFRSGSHPFVDVTEISRRAASNPAAWLAEDLLHPSRTMHDAWSKPIADAIWQAMVGGQEASGEKA
jgi:lysophospholipase L1-like esterase